jgi:hypothetical protein
MTLIDVSKEVGLEVNIERKLSMCWCLATRMQANLGKLK